ncbi:MAG: hypothetical protein Q4B82_09305 [Alysiella sp.]|uniref:hypothetical protein n=1 Tax=Alysiella sp. TaxID=1872483 RepID=UPI0026DD7D38|nr:hypothetical protein [Alysiella sp.]MDO4434756.1 hypothetical protein [Alysiella sp.]
MKLSQSALKHSLLSSLIYAILLLLSQIFWDNQSFNEAIRSTAFSSIVFGILTYVFIAQIEPKITHWLNQKRR